MSFEVFQRSRGVQKFITWGTAQNQCRLSSAAWSYLGKPSSVNLHIDTEAKQAALTSAPASVDTFPSQGGRITKSGLPFILSEGRTPMRDGQIDGQVALVFEAETQPKAGD